VGEQFALPEAVDALRETRRARPDEETLLISAADPLNLEGIISPNPRISPYSNQVIAYRDGQALGAGLLGEMLSKVRQTSAQQS
jgi:ATP-dependent Lhr-like helicase